MNKTTIVCNGFDFTSVRYYNWISCLPSDRYFKDPVTYICLRCTECCGDEQDFIIKECQTQKDLGKRVCSDYHRMTKCYRTTTTGPQVSSASLSSSTTTSELVSTPVKKASSTKPVENVERKPIQSSLIATTITTKITQKTLSSSNSNLRCLDYNRRRKKQGNNISIDFKMQKQKKNLLVLNRDIFISVTAIIVFLMLVLLFVVVTLLLKLYKQQEKRLVVMKSFLAEQERTLTDEERHDEETV